jgi:hypothetical protein
MSKLTDVERLGTDGVGSGAKYVRGAYPRCRLEGPITGRWYATSPYIEDVEVDAPDDGGPPVIFKGQEPGRFGGR